MLAIAIETSTPHAQVALGNDTGILTTTTLTQERRHNLEIVPAIDELLAQHGLEKAQLTHCFAALGPGSFTGLRIAVTTAKMLAMTLKLELVGVPSLDILAANADPATPTAVCLNTKRRTTYCAVYHQSKCILPADIRTFETVAERVPAGTVYLGQALPGHLPQVSAEAVIPKVETVFQLAKSLPPIDPHALQPLYIREPEAVTVWNERHGNT